MSEATLCSAVDPKQSFCMHNQFKAKIKLCSSVKVIWQYFSGLRAKISNTILAVFQGNI